MNMKKKAFFVLPLMVAITLIGCGSSTGATSAELKSASEEIIEESTQDATETPETSETSESPAQYEITEPETEDPSEEADTPEDEVAGIDLPADFWIDTSCTYTDDNGYVVEKNVKLSKMISMDSPEIAQGVWEQLGGSQTEIPDLADCKNTSRYWNDFNWETGYYIMGTVEYTNKTEGFSFTSDKPYDMGLRSFNDYFGDSLGMLTNEPGGMPATDSFPSSFTRAFYPDGSRNYATDKFYDNAFHCLLFGPIKMSADSWGPVRFIICIADTSTPNNPDGFPEYDGLYYQIIDNDPATMEHTGAEAPRIHIEKYN